MDGFAQQALAIACAALTPRAMAQPIAAIGYTITGESERADAAYSAALAAYMALGDLQSTAALTSDWPYSLVIREELPRAASQLEKALDYARQMHNLRLEARALSNLA